MSPSITICAGVTLPAENFSSSTTKPCLDRISSGIVLIPAKPVPIFKTGTAAAINNPPASTRLITGRRMTPWETQVQKPPAAVASALTAPVYRQHIWDS